MNTSKEKPEIFKGLKRIDMTMKDIPAGAGILVVGSGLIGDIIKSAITGLFTSQNINPPNAAQRPKGTSVDIHTLLITSSLT